MKKEQIAVGIIGTGNIAKKFAEGVANASGAYLYGVASRGIEKAESFREEFGAVKAYGSYEDLVQDEIVDLIYISTPNSFHKENTLLCLKHQKAVICEKPFTTNAKELEEVIKVAKDQNTFLMEAMWTRYFPVIKEVRKLVEEGLLGKISLVQGDFGYYTNDLQNVRFNKALAGGALLDVGIYPISLASMIFKEQPEVIKAIAKMGETGIDEKTSILFGYKDGGQALLNCAMDTVTPRNAYIVGEKGIIHIPDPWFATKAIIKLHGQEAYEIIEEEAKNGYHFEVEEAVNCLQQDKKESEAMTLEESLAIMRTLDRVRVEIGLQFEADK